MHINRTHHPYKIHFFWFPVIHRPVSAFSWNDKIMTILVLLDKCEAIAPACIAEIMTGGKLPKGGGTWRVGNEIKPSDLYCYLYARFGPPNGIQNFLRTDDSDNLIHWEWTLACKNGLIQFMGMNLRTEIIFLGDWNFPLLDKDQLINHIKNDFSSYGKRMSEIRRERLENWDVFVNPYKQIKNVILQLKNDLEELNLNPNNEKLENPSGGLATLQKFIEDWKTIAERYNKGIGLALSLRIMMPILAESFINLIIFVLCRPDIKKNERLFDSFVRQNIDIRIQSLHVNCIGFQKSVDWSSKECKAYNTIVNSRNDLLHGNIALSKLKFSEIFFNGKVPVFKQYESMWKQSIGVSINSSGLTNINTEFEIVNSFIEYVYSCLDPSIKKQVFMIAEKRDLGMNKDSGIIGILLPDHLADFGVSFISDKANKK